MAKSPQMNRLGLAQKVNGINGMVNSACSLSFILFHLSINQRRKDCDLRDRWYYLHHTGGCYNHFWDLKVTRAEAHKRCVAEGGELASVTDQTTNDFLLALTKIRGEGRRGYQAPAWIGGRRERSFKALGKKNGACFASPSIIASFN